MNCSPCSPGAVYQHSGTPIACDTQCGRQQAYMPCGVSMSRGSPVSIDVSVAPRSPGRIGYGEGGGYWNYAPTAYVGPHVFGNGHFWPVAPMGSPVYGNGHYGPVAPMGSPMCGNRYCGPVAPMGSPVYGNGHCGTVAPMGPQGCSNGHWGSRAAPLRSPMGTPGRPRIGYGPIGGCEGGCRGGCCVREGGWGYVSYARPVLRTPVGRLSLDIDIKARAPARAGGNCRGPVTSPVVTSPRPPGMKALPGSPPMKPQPRRLSIDVNTSPGVPCAPTVAPPAPVQRRLSIDMNTRGTGCTPTSASNPAIVTVPRPAACGPVAAPRRLSIDVSPPRNGVQALYCPPAVPDINRRPGAAAGCGQPSRPTGASGPRPLSIDVNTGGPAGHYIVQPGKSVIPGKRRLSVDIDVNRSPTGCGPLSPVVSPVHYNTRGQVLGPDIGSSRVSVNVESHGRVGVQPAPVVEPIRAPASREAQKQVRRLSVDVARNVAGNTGGQVCYAPRTVPVVPAVIVNSGSRQRKLTFEVNSGSPVRGGAGGCIIQPSATNVSGQRRLSIDANPGSPVGAGCYTPPTMLPSPGPVSVDNRGAGCTQSSPVQSEHHGQPQYCGQQRAVRGCGGGCGGHCYYY